MIISEFQYKLEDFATGLEPFEFVYSFYANPFQHERMLKAVSDYAKSIGFIGFTKQYKAYLKTMQGAGKTLDNPTNFTGQSMELNAGNWIADDAGVSRESAYGTEYACMHPIMPVERLVNIDTGEEKMRLAYRKGKNWRTLVVDKRILASANKITELASSGILVTSENAKLLVRYLSDLDALNYDVLPERKSVGRLGYIPGEGFSPYVKGLIFDGDGTYHNLFQSVTQKGSYENWKRLAMEVREMSTTAKIMLAASFASPLLEPLGALPFFVHLWSVDSGSGKTVALMLAASVWGNPALGAYVKTFDSTDVGSERVAAFLNHLPFCMDELQLTKNTRGQSTFDVYKLAQGVGRTRGNRSGGIDFTPTWRNTILTTGEDPLTGQSAGAGAVNRVIDIECLSEDPVVIGGKKVAADLARCYGHAGKHFVQRLYQSGEADSRANELYDRFFDALSREDTTEKQAMAAGAILTGDTLACDWIFDGKAKPLTVSEISAFLASKASVSLGARGYEFLCDWVASNAASFTGGSEGILARNFGYIDEGRGEAYIIRPIFNEVVEEKGFSQKSLLSYLKQKRLIRCDSRGKGYTIRKRMGRTNPNCVCLKLPENVMEYSEDENVL